MIRALTYVAMIASSVASFLSVGDWGSASIGGQHLQNIQAVSSQMTDYAKSHNSQFVLNTGDNFYYCGIQSIYDYQINEDYTKQFGSMNIPWYNTLGNHDYGYNVSAQLDLPTIIPNWIMDDRYYTRKIKVRLLSNNYANIYAVFIDTNPCIKVYISDDPSGWDPCGTQYPTCSQHNSNDNFEGECLFHANIVNQSCERQYVWFEKIMEFLHKQVAEDKIVDNIHSWIIVIGHHLANEIDEKPFAKLIDNYAHLYLNGHQHMLTHYSLNGNDKYVTTGAGGMVSVSNYSDSISHSHNAQQDPNVVWSQTVAGFTAHTFESNGSVLRTDFITHSGDIVHSFKTLHISK